jgi:pyruvate carboxylase
MLDGLFFVGRFESHSADDFPPTDRFTQHRYKADQAFELDGGKSPVAQYLDIETIVKICVANGVQAVRILKYSTF